MAGGELWRSDDAGERWRALDRATEAIAVAPERADRLFLLSGAPGRVVLGISDDGGETATPVVEEGDRLATSPRRAGETVELVAGTSRGGGRLLVVASAGVVLASVDEGRTWVAAVGLPAAPAQSFGPLLVDPARPGRVYLADRTAGGVHTSGDDGGHWTAQPRGLPSNVVVGALAADRERGRVIALAERVGSLRRQSIYWLPRPGAAWRLVEDGIPRAWVLADIESTPVGWRALGFDRLRRPALFGSPNGLSWHRLADREVPLVEPDGARWAGGSVFVFDAETQRLSSDDGVSWRRAIGPWRARGLQEVGLDARGGGTLFAVEGPGLALSIDGGASWEMAETVSPPGGYLHFDDPPQPVAGLPRQFVRVVRSAETCEHSAVAHSSDRGRTWTLGQVWAGVAAPVAVSPTRPNSLFMMSNGFGPGCDPDCVVVRSRDRGASGECLNDAIAGVLPQIGGPVVNDLLAIRFAADARSVLLEGPRGWAASGDDGDTWELVAAPEAEVLARGPAGSGVFYGRRDGGLVRSDDDGASWHPLSPPLTGRVLAAAVRDGDLATVAVISTSEVALSRDGGDSWETLPVLPAMVRELAAIGIVEHPSPTVVVGSHGGSGVLAYPLAGDW